MSQEDIMEAAMRFWEHGIPLLVVAADKGEWYQKFQTRGVRFAADVTELVGAISRREPIAFLVKSITEIDDAIVDKMIVVRIPAR